LSDDNFSGHNLIKTLSKDLYKSADLADKPSITDDQILALLEKETSYEQGFKALMSAYQERLYWHVRRMVDNHEDANDVIQNVFIKVFRNIKKFKGDSKLYTWLYRIATNESITFLNKRKKKATNSLDDELSTVAHQLTADSYFDPDEAQRHLKAAIAILPEKQKAVFNLRYYEEMPYAEMAKVLDTTVGALKASYHHGLKKVETYLKNVEHNSL